MVTKGDKCLAHGCDGIYIEELCKTCSGRRMLLKCNKCGRTFRNSLSLSSPLKVHNFKNGEDRTVVL